ncbi:MAG TPA: hypothetical protein VNH82_02460 [Candidatus Dormibacteraeota bacterium]|nr:hypothetical protein [Candidatus Dormibacteraeota bacterium]
MVKKEHWKTDPDPHDFPAAGDYLSLTLGRTQSQAVVRKLRAAALTQRMAKDLLRASRLPLLAADDHEVARDLKKVRKGELLSPVLLVRGSLGTDVPLTIADGYHRVCASYHLDEDATISCRLVDNAAS